MEFAAAFGVRGLFGADQWSGRGFTGIERAAGIWPWWSQRVEAVARRRV